MNVIFKKDLLVDALQKVAPALPRSSPRPALACIHIETAGNDVVLSATDLTVAVRCRVEAKEVRSSGSGLIGGKIVGLLREGREEEVSVVIESGRAEVKAGRASLSLLAPGVDEYPALPVFGEKVLTIEGRDVARLVGATVFATAQEQGRYAIQSVSVTAKGGKVEFAATDGRRLAVARAKVKEGDDMGPCLVPPRMLAELRRMGDSGGDVEFALDGGALLARSGSVLVAGRLTEGTFPAYNEMIPKQQGALLEANIDELISRLRQASQMTTENSRAIVLKITGENTTLEANSAAVGEASIVVETKYDAAPVEVSFNPQYLLDGLQELAQDEDRKVRIEIGGAGAPAVLRSEGFVYVVATIKRGSA